MTFEARDRATLVRDLLGRLGARYDEAGETLDTRVGSPAWLRAQALGAILESLDLQAAAAEDQILPDRAAGLHLAAHGELAEVARESLEQEAWRTEILGWWREGMAPMGAADWIELLESHPEVDRVFVYPGVDPDAGIVDTHGCTTFVVLGAPQGDAATMSVPDLDAIRAWLAGTEDAVGVAELGPERRPVCAHPDSVRVIRALESSAALTVSIENEPTHPFPWTGTMTPVSITATTLVVSGNHTDKLGLPCLVNTTGSFVVPQRGGFGRVVPSSASYDGGTGNTTFTFTDAVFQAPFTLAGSDVYPCPPNWERVREAVFALLDTLGPGDTSPSRRFPPPDVERPATLYPAALRAAVLEVEGVVNTTTTLASPTTPAFGFINTVSTLTVQPL